jgi:hypothetical protein
MKYLYLLLIAFLTVNSQAQTYNIVLDPVLGVGGATNIVPPGQTFFAGARVQNKSTASITAINFYWYLSTDAVYSTNDLLISTYDITSGDLLLPNGWSDVGTRFAVVPDGYAPGCNYYVIMRAVISQSETVYTDNFSSGTLCIRAKQIDLKGTSITPDAATYYRGINNTNTIVSAVITNDGELPASGTISYDLKLGTSSDPAVGNISSVRKTLPSLAAKTSNTVSQTFNISALAAGTYYLFLQVDPDNLINDPVTNNNSVMQTFQIANLDSLSGQNVLMPTGTESRYVATCGATIYDNGGSTGNYLPNTNSTLYLYPGETNKKIRVKISEYNFAGADNMKIVYYASPFIGYRALDISNTSTFPIEFIPPAADGRLYITQFSDAATEASGAKIEISCAPAFEYQTIVSATSKPTYVAGVDEIGFTAGIKNRGYNTVSALNYTYGLSAAANQDNILYESAINTIAQINVNSSVAIPAANKILLKDLNLQAGTYYVFVKGTGIDDDLLDNISYYPVNIVVSDTVKNVSVNFQNNKIQYFTSCNMTLYDDGGANGNYSNNFSGQIAVFPDTPDKIVKLTLTYNLETKFSGNSIVLKDVLTIYDGLTNVKKLTLPHSYGAPVYYTNGTAIIDFASDAATNSSGFKITVGCANKGVDYKNEVTDIKIDTAIYGVDKLISTSIKATTNGSVNGIPQYGVLAYKVYVSPTPDKANAIFTSPVNSYSLDNTTNAFDGSFTLNLSALPAIASSGKYYFITEVDPANSIIEVDESNNVLVDSFYIKLLPPGEIRFSATGTNTVTACNSKLYGYAGLNKSTSLVDYYSPPTIQIKPADAKSKLKFIVNAYTFSSYNVRIVVYDRAVNASFPVFYVTRDSQFPISYTAANAGSQLEIQIDFLSSSTSNSYRLDADIVCVGAFDLALNNSSIDENVIANSVVGTFGAVTAAPADVFTYEFATGTGDSDNGSFVLSGDQLQIKNSPDFETKNSYTIRVRGKNQNKAVVEKSFTVNINDLNEVPVDFSLSAYTIQENMPANTIVGTFNTTDPDAGNTFTYELISGAGDTDNMLFAINGDDLVVVGTFDYEIKNNYSVLVKSSDQDGLSFVKSIIVSVLDQNEKPGVANQNYSIDENLSLGSSVGTVAATTDSGEELTYSIASGNESGAFAIDAATGEITVATALSYNTTPGYQLLVTVTDNSTLFLDSSAVVTIQINEVMSTAVKNGRSNAMIHLYPNPSSGTVIVDVLDTSVSIQKITIINALGEIVLIRQYTKQLDLSGLASGLYTVLLSDGKASYTKQIVIQ